MLRFSRKGTAFLTQKEEIKFPGRAAFYCLIASTAIIRSTSSLTAGRKALTSKSLGLKALHLNASQLGLLFPSMGVGSVVGAAFIFPRLRDRYSPNMLIILANLLVVLVYVLMAVVPQKDLFSLVAALAGIGWTLSASELWVAAQRAIPTGREVA